MDTEEELFLVGPFVDRAEVDTAFATLGYIPKRADSPEPPANARWADVYIRNERGGIWLDVDESVARRLAQQAKRPLRGFRATIENRVDADVHAVALEAQRFRDGRFEVEDQDEFEEEELIRGGMLRAVGLYYLLEYASEHEASISRPSDPPSEGEYVAYVTKSQPPAPLEEEPKDPMVRRAREALAGAVAHETNVVGEKVHLKMTLPDGSRRILILTPAQWESTRGT